MRTSKSGLSLSPLALLTLAACGGGGKSGSSGIIVNGNVHNGAAYHAFVFLDYNGDELYDDGSGFNLNVPSIV